MKTIEEISNILYPDVSFEEDIESEDTFRKNEIRLLERMAFIKGYIAAQYWYDPKKQRPPYGIDILIKAKSNNEVYVVQFKKFMEVDQFFTKYNTYFNINDVKGWRLI